MSDSIEEKAEETAKEILDLFTVAEPLTFTQPQEMNLMFYQDNEYVGKFWYDQKFKEFRFEGDKAKSATEFVAWCLVTFKEQLKDYYIERPENKDDT